MVIDSFGARSDVAVSIFSSFGLFLKISRQFHFENFCTLPRTTNGLPSGRSGEKQRPRKPREFDVLLRPCGRQDKDIGTVAIRMRFADYSCSRSASRNR